MAYRVIQWATGEIGQEVIRAVLADPSLELVGALVYSESKDGKDVGEIVGAPPTGVRATRDKDAIYALDADVVIHAPLGHKRSEEHDRDVERLLASGKNVISTRGYFNCRAYGEEYAARFEAACKKGGTTLAGLGMSPGFVAERIATTLTGASLSLDHLTVSETYDCTWLQRSLLKKLGFGMSPAEYEATPISTNYDEFYVPVVHSVLETLGKRPDRVESRHTYEVADADIPEASLPISKGTVHATARRWVGFIGDKPRFTMEYRWFVGRVAGWPDRSMWTFETEGRPPYRMTLEFGGPHETGPRREKGLDMMTAVLLRAVPDIVAAPPGFFATPVFAPYSFA